MSDHLRSWMRTLCLFSIVVTAAIAATPLSAADPFQEKVIPFVQTYCAKCHNESTTEGELNLTRYQSATMIAEDFRQWDHVLTFLKKKEMPPAEARQPSAELRAEILVLLESLLKEEARKLAGDPGEVLPRRLSNAEYNYTVRDLTGVDIRPADAFPVDPASGEGFNNTGEALTMSPALFKKYYAAAQHIADHLLLTPTGLEFAPYPVITYADQKQYVEQAIIQFYEEHGVDYEAYLLAAWKYHHRGNEKKSQTIAQWATRENLSPKYLASLWTALNDNGSNDQIWMKWLRSEWNGLPSPENPHNPVPSGDAMQKLRVLAANIRKLAEELCIPETAAIVSNAGNGPIQHIDRRKKTAANRDAFNSSLIRPSQRLSWEFRNIPKNELVKIVIRTAPFENSASDSNIILSDLNFSDSRPDRYKPTDSDRNRSLISVLTEFAPDQLKKLKMGTHPAGDEIPADACVLKAPGTLEIDVPIKAFPDQQHVHFYVEAKLDPKHVGSGAVRIQLTGSIPKEKNDTLALAMPLVDPQSDIASQMNASGEAFCRLFPNRFYYVDGTRGLSAGFHLIEGFFRDDQPLCKLVLSDEQNQQLDRLWNELYFVTGITKRMLRGFVFFERSERNFMKHPDFDVIKEEDPALFTPETLQRFEEIYLSRSNVKGSPEEIANHPVHVFFEEVRNGVASRDAQLEAAAPIYVQQLKEFAATAFRRPLTVEESAKLEAFYQDVSSQPEFGIEQAARATVIRTLVSPHFCFRVDPAPTGDAVSPLSDLALASRLSYFLWSSMPDAELLTLAEAGKLNDEKILREQTRRMLKDPKVSGFALEFFGQWLGHRDFPQQESVNRSVFPMFDEPLKQAMFEEPTRVITHLIQNDLPATDLLSSDRTFLNKRLAQHYGMPFNGPDGEWQLFEGIEKHGRGGLMGMAVFLTKNSQPQRTSPVKRGFWVVHKVLGEHIPPPPPDVAVLPAKETDTEGKTIRQLMALHTDDNKCARCHVRFDPIGLSMEGFDPIGRVRNKDLAGRAIDNVVHLPSGEEARGVAEFAKYLASERKADFTKTLNHKLLGYAFGRSLQLSDDLLLEAMQAELDTHGSRLTTVFETIVTSPQFRNQRCRDFTLAGFKNALKEPKR